MTIYCSNCGEENEDSAKFCRKCGASLNSNIKKINSSDNLGNVNKKYIITGLIIILAVILIAAGAYFAFSQNNMKTMDFGAYTMDVPDDANFINNSSTAGLSSFVDSTNHLMTTFIYTDSLSNAAGAAGIKASFESYPTVNNDKLKVNNCTIHKISTGGDFGYVALYNPTGIYIVVASDNLDELVEMVNSIQVKTIQNTTSSSSSDTSSSSSNSGSSSSSSSGISSQGTVNINGNDYNRVYYSDGSYKTYGTKTGLLYQNTHDSQPTEAEVYDHPI
ncbi:MULTISPECIES: zinc ribbon domain-containing protein [unclassified Methanobrevibacter]|jgi:hypothetical protein|uniref:zinc ribbon domain-containing protein n=1 Tax=unclassified Methanobrevibacter TaxID=2638681 RepID=UPI0039B925AA